MPTQNILDVSLVPVSSAAPSGPQVTLVSYQESGKAIHVVMLPTATPTLAQVSAAIVADVAFRGQFIGQKVTTP